VKPCRNLIKYIQYTHTRIKVLQYMLYHTGNKTWRRGQHDLWDNKTASKWNVAQKWNTQHNGI